MYHHKPLPQSLNCLLRSGRCPAGWTLPEVLAVVAIVGILAGLAIPSLMGIKARMDTRANFSALKQALQQSQRNAIRMGKECRVIMDTSSEPPQLRLDSAPKYVGCLPFKELSLNEAKFYENFPGTAIRFSHKGNSTNMGTIVIQSSSFPMIRYCLVMSGTIGIMRGGVYQTAPESSVSMNNCNTSF